MRDAAGTEYENLYCLLEASVFQVRLRMNVELPDVIVSDVESR